MDSIDKNYLLTEILKKLAMDTSLDEEKMDNYSKNFEDIYKDHFRHEYSEVTRVLFSIKDENRDARDFLPEKIKNIRDVLEKKSSNKSTIESMDKLWDHINLENIRMNELENITESVKAASKEAKENYVKAEKIDIEIEEINKTIKNINIKTNKFNSDMRKYNDNLNSSKNKLNSLQKTMKDSTTQSITILSIFAGVVMAFTGGMSYISQALASLNKIGPYRAGIFIVLIGTVMFNLIFLLLYMIGKLTDKYIGSATCNCKDPARGCNSRKFNCSIKRYPYIIWFNLISLIIITTILIVIFLDKYDLFVYRFIDIVTAFKWYKLGQDLVIIACISIIYVIFGIAIHKIYSIECENNEQ